MKRGDYFVRAMPAFEWWQNEPNIRKVPRLALRHKLFSIEMLQVYFGTKELSIETIQTSKCKNNRKICFKFLFMDTNTEIPLIKQTLADSL